MAARSVVGKIVVVAAGIGVALSVAGPASAATASASEVSKTGSGKEKTTFAVSGGDTTGELILLSADTTPSAGAPQQTGPIMDAVPQVKAGG